MPLFKILPLSHTPEILAAHGEINIPNVFRLGWLTGQSRGLRRAYDRWLIADGRSRGWFFVRGVREKRNV